MSSTSQITSLDKNSHKVTVNAICHLIVSRNVNSNYTKEYEYEENMEKNSTRLGYHYLQIVYK